MMSHYAESNSVGHAVIMAGMLTVPGNAPGARHSSKLITRTSPEHYTRRDFCYLITLLRNDMLLCTKNKCV